MSVGDTPEIRDAWPTVAGRIFINFCRASIPWQAVQTFGSG